MKTNATAEKSKSGTKLVVTSSRLKQLNVKRERGAKYCLKSS